MLVSADRHLDNPHTNLRMQKRHLAQAKERDAAVFDFGDLFDAMQGRHDRRSSKTALKGSLARDDYMNALTEEAVEFFDPYRENLALFGLGNHETSVLKQNEYGLTRALVNRLRDRGSGVVLGGYRGWVRLLFSAKGGGRQSLNLCYMHGSGGGGPVTKGVLQCSRNAVSYPDADIVVSGHVHEQWVFPITRLRLADSGREYLDKQTHICTPTYKDEITGHGAGWAVEKGLPPKPLGAWWLRFRWDTENQRVKFDTLQAD